MPNISKEDAKLFDNPYKIGLVAMQDDEGDMHVCLLTTLMNKGDDQMMFGEFVRGSSKKFIYQHPDTGFLLMTVDRKFWTGKMTFTHSVTEGEDYVHMNQYQLFRFNTYFGVCDVHYADLHEISEGRDLNMPGVIANAVRVMAIKPFFAGDKSKQVMRPWTQKFMNGLITLKYIAYMGEDGFPKIVPIIQAQAASSSRIFFTRAPYSAMLKDLKDGARVAIYGMSLDMEVTLLKGYYHDAPGGFGYMDIDKIYNSAPPITGYAYPEFDHNDPVDFHDEPLAPNWI